MNVARRPCVSAVARSSALLVAAWLLLPAAAPAQSGSDGSVTDRIVALAERNSKRYLHPVVSGLGAGLSSGFFAAASAGGGVTLRAGVRVSGSLIPEVEDSFEPVLPERITFRDRTFTDPYQIEGDRATTPTAAGEARGVVLVPRAGSDFEASIQQAGGDPDDFELPFPDGADLAGVPLASARVTLGLPTGTSLTASYLPEIKLNDDVGPVSSHGIGVRQSVTDFASRAPVDVAVAAGYRKLTLGDVGDATGKSASLIVSRNLELITVFASGGLEESTLDVEYTFESTADVPGRPALGETIFFEDEGENDRTFTGGLQLDLFLGRLTVSYTAAEYDVLRAGLSFGG